MSGVSYQNLLHATALLANALVGSQVATLETTYQTATLTSANFKSADFPFSYFKDAILHAEEDFVNAVAFTGEHPWRSALAATTAALTSPSVLPAVDSNGVPFVGVWGRVYDSSDNIALVEMPMDVITRRVRNANTNYVCPVYYYKIDGRTIYHTRTSVVVEGCIYSRPTQATAYSNNGTMVLPDTAESGIVARALSYLFRDGAYAEQAAVWRQYSNDALAAIRTGATNIVPRSVPVPVTQVKAG